jgi:hypothetical protein
MIAVHFLLHFVRPVPVDRLDFEFKQVALDITLWKIYEYLFPLAILFTNPYWCCFVVELLILLFHPRISLS